jgi:uncharacterized protein (DUF2384 family)
MATKPPVSVNDIMLVVNAAVRGEPAQKAWLDTPQPYLYNFRPSDLLTTQAGRDKLAAMLKEIGLMI